MSIESDSASVPSSTDNVCRVSSWFFRRMAMLILLTGGLGFYFLYDGMVGYPKKNFTVSLYESFESGQDGKNFDPAAFSSENLDTEKLDELKKANEAGQSGATWAGFAADRMLPEKVPERYTEADIEEQFRFAVIMGVVALVILGFCLWQRTRKYLYDEVKLVTPSGKTFQYARFQMINLERWDRGIALLSWEEEGEGSKLLKLDDYKYDGIGKLLLKLSDSIPEIEIKGDRRWLEATAAGEVNSQQVGESDANAEKTEPSATDDPVTDPAEMKTEADSESEPGKGD